MESARIDPVCRGRDSSSSLSTSAFPRSERRRHHRHPALLHRGQRGGGPSYVSDGTSRPMRSRNIRGRLVAVSRNGRPTPSVAVAVAPITPRAGRPSSRQERIVKYVHSTSPRLRHRRALSRFNCMPAGGNVNRIGRLRRGRRHRLLRWACRRRLRAMLDLRHTTIGFTWPPFSRAQVHIYQRTGGGYYSVVSLRPRPVYTSRRGHRPESSSSTVSERRR